METLFALNILNQCCNPIFPCLELMYGNVYAYGLMMIRLFTLKLPYPIEVCTMQQLMDGGRAGVLVPTKVLQCGLCWKTFVLLLLSKKRTRRTRKKMNSRSTNVQNTRSHPEHYFFSSLAHTINHWQHS